MDITAKIKKEKRHVDYRWAPASYKWSIMELWGPYEWPYKWVSGVITTINGMLICPDSGVLPNVPFSGW